MSFLCSFPLWDCFSVKDMVADRVLRSLEVTQHTSDSEDDAGVSQMTLSPGPTLEIGNGPGTHCVHMCTFEGVGEYS